MDSELKKQLSKDPDGLLTYEYIANHIGLCDDDMDALVDNMISVDKDGQFCVSAARYLNAISAEHYASPISRLIEAATDKDRERSYIGQLLPEVWGRDYSERAAELMDSDRNFRRIYQRIHPVGI